MIDISVQNIVKAFDAGENILDGVTFDINTGEHVGLLGKNGAGKTTLFRILCGEIESDEGNVILAPGKKVGLISQIPNYPFSHTGEDVLRDAFREASAVRRQLDLLERRMAEDPEGAIPPEYDRLLNEYERLGGYEMEYEINRVANGLEIPAAQRRQSFRTLSGGEQTRMNLARLILEKTDILLLDEPTNHLDVNAVEWLEDYLSRFRGTVLTISHDRRFLDHTVTRIIELNKGRAEFYSGNYTFFAEEKQRRYELQLKRYEAEQAEARRLQAAADRLHQWGTGNQLLVKKAFAIESRIDRLLQTERPDREKALRARFGEAAFDADDVLVMKGVSGGFDGRKLFELPELRIKGGESIALIGDNGTGKSTLIRMITGERKPDTGTIRKGPQVRMALLPQIVRFEHPERTLLDTMIYDGACTPQTARNRLGSFKFSGEDVFKRVADLSGGEKSRLKLCLLMGEAVNLLILDEPTNHLDIVSREWIEEALASYEGTLLFVSHDRYFTSKFATRIWELEDGTIRDFRGTYDEYRAFRARRAEEEPAPVPEKPKRPPAAPPAEKPKRPKNAERLLAKLEKQIADLEARQAGIAAEIEANATDYLKLTELQEEQARAAEELDALMEQWLTLSEQTE